MLQEKQHTGCGAPRGPGIRWGGAMYPRGLGERESNSHTKGANAGLGQAGPRPPFLSLHIRKPQYLKVTRDVPPASRPRPGRGTSHCPRQPQRLREGSGASLLGDSGGGAPEGLAWPESNLRKETESQIPFLVFHKPSGISTVLKPLLGAAGMFELDKDPPSPPPPAAEVPWDF